MEQLSPQIYIYLMQEFYSPYLDVQLTHITGTNDTEFCRTKIESLEEKYFHQIKNTYTNAL